MQVEEIGKPAGARCIHASEVGCSIYPSRPKSCRTFDCMWLMSIGTKKHRPDRVGAVMHVSNSPKLGQIIVVRESRPGALGREKAKTLMRQLKKLAKEAGVYINKLDGTVDIMGSKGFIEKAIDVTATMNEEQASRVHLKVIQ